MPHQERRRNPYHSKTWSASSQVYSFLLLLMLRKWPRILRTISTFQTGIFGLILHCLNYVLVASSCLTTGIAGNEKGATTSLITKILRNLNGPQHPTAHCVTSFGEVGHPDRRSLLMMIWRYLRSAHISHWASVYILVISMTRTFHC